MQHLLGSRTLDLLGVEVPRANRLERLILRSMLGVVKRGEHFYQRRVGRDSFLRASVALHEMVTARVTQLPAGHKQVFLPEHVRRVAEETGRRPFEIIADPPL